MKVKTQKSLRNLLFMISLVFLYAAIINIYLWEWLFLVAITTGIMSIILSIKMYERKQDEEKDKENEEEEEK